MKSASVPATQPNDPPPTGLGIGDEVEKFVLLSHGHDGTLAVRVGFTPIRVVCANTLALAHRADASKLIRVRHSASVIENLANVREVMNLANAEFEATAEQYRLLARKSINQNDLRRYVKKVLKVEGDNISTRTMNMIQDIIGRCESGKGNNLASVRGTLWTAYNGVPLLPVDRDDIPGAIVRRQETPLLL
jgi:hypothetical protein